MLEYITDIGCVIMTYDEILNYVEDSKLILENNFFYHSFIYEQKYFQDMITKGIKSPILLNKKANSYNGYFYISLSKNEECNNSIYRLTFNYPRFIINPNLKVIKTSNFKFKNYPYTTKQCKYDDEYLKFLFIDSNDILGIQYNLSSIFADSNDNYKKEQLIILKNIVNDLIKLNINISIIDSYNDTQINKNKVLEILDN